MSYRTVVLDTEPVAYYRLGEPISAVMVDELYGHHGSYLGSPEPGPSLIQGTTNRSRVIDTANGYEVSAAPFDGGPISLALWLANQEPDPGGGFHYVALGSAWPAESYTLGYYNSSGVCELRFFVTDGVSFPFAVAPTFADTDAHFVVGTYDGATIRIYLDGAEGTPAAFTHTPASTGLRSGSLPFPVFIDELAVWNRALSAAEVARLYEAATIGTAFSAARAEFVAALVDAGIEVHATPGGDPPYVFVRGDGVADPGHVVRGSVLGAFAAVCVAGAWDDGGAAAMLDTLKAEVLAVARSLPGWQLGPVSRDTVRRLGASDYLTADVSANRHVGI